MARGKHKVFHEVETLQVQPSSYDIPAVRLAELGEIVGLDDLPLQASRL